MRIRRIDFRQVTPTPEEVTEWRRKRGDDRRPPRAQCKVCGKRIWYSGLAVGSHLRVCPRTIEQWDKLGSE